MTLRIIKGKRQDQSSNILDFQKELAKKRLKVIKESKKGDVVKKTEPPEPNK